jgi:hypothetical protein
MKKVITSLLIALASAAAAQIPTSGLIGRWEFSGNANDGSGSGNHGTVVGATLVNDRCGNPNSAYSFNGISDYITMLYSGPTGSASRSISFWMKTNYTALSPTSMFTYGDATPGGAFQVLCN